MSKKKSLRERLLEQRESLKKSGPGKFLTIKEGITRFRVLNTGEENDWAQEVSYFYLGVKDNMGVISPATFGEKCAIMNAHNEMSNSKSADDRDFAKKFRPQRKFLVPVIRYKDAKGQEIDTEAGKKLLLISGGLYQEMIDLWTDDDNGDFTDPIKGYDLKIKRTGKGKNDTEYTLLTGKPSKLDKAYREEVDLEAMVREIIPSYKETKTILEQYLNLPPQDDDDDDKSSNKKSSKTKKKKKKSRDL